MSLAEFADREMAEVSEGARSWACWSFRFSVIGTDIGRFLQATERSERQKEAEKNRVRRYVSTYRISRCGRYWDSLGCSD